MGGGGGAVEGGEQGSALCCELWHAMQAPRLSCHTHLHPCPACPASLPPPPPPQYRTCTAAVSDIPDWCFVEAWGSEEGRRRAGAGPSSDDIQRFRDVSPVAHVGQVGGGLNCRAGAPSCVCVGGEQVCGDLDRP